MKTKYIPIKEKTPEPGEKVLVGATVKPMIPKVAIYKNGKFYDAYDLEIQLYPTHWKSF